MAASDWKLFCALAVMLGAFCWHFGLQEGLLPKSGGPDDFHFPSALAFISSTFNVAFALAIGLWQRTPIARRPWRYLMVTIPQQAAVVAFTYAQLRLDYPTLQLFKAAKPVAVLCSQIVVSRRLPDFMRVFVVLLISAGFAVFRLGGRFSTFSPFGSAIALFGLLCDAIYVPVVDRLKVAAGGPYVLMLYAQLWSMALFAAVRFRELVEAARWIAAHPSFAQRLLVFGCSGAVGQVALFTAVGMTDGLLVSVATTLRKIFTILISAILYRHGLKRTEWAGIVIVFTALGLEAVSKKRQPRERDQ